MNNIITLDSLAALLAEKVRISHDEAYIQIQNSLNEIVKELLNDSGCAIVPHFGKFYITNRATGEIAFEPAENLSESINEPFAFFEPVELFVDEIDKNEDSISEIPLSVKEDEQTTEINNPIEEDIDINAVDNPAKQDSLDEAVAEVAEALIEMTNKPESNTETEQTTSNPVPIHYRYTLTEDEIKPATEIIKPEPDSLEHSTAGNATETTSAISDSVVTKEVESTETTSDNATEEQTVDYSEPQPEGMRPLIAYILGILTGMLLTCVAVYFLYPPLNFTDDEELIWEEIDDNSTNETSTSTESALESTGTQQTSTGNDDTSHANATTISSPQTSTPNTTNSTSTLVTVNKVITDTVSRTNYLAIMARKYYGNTEFWVYIYKENEAKLGNPDRVPAGTVVVIPPASKYGIDANDPESIKRAKKLNGPIYAPYKK